MAGFGSEPTPTPIGAMSTAGQGSDPNVPGFAGFIEQGSNQAAAWGGVAATALAAQERAQGFFSKALPWKDFLIPMSKPEPGQGFIRITSNLYQFQVNYAILFLVQ